MAFWCCGTGRTSGVASKNAAQLRSLESIGLSRGNSPRLRRAEVQIPVTLNVYSLLESNKKLSKMGMGVFHTGVVVYGIEWGYGEVVENPNASGLFCVHPGQAAGTLYRTIRIGHTTRSPMQVDTILHRLENEWRSCEYHILHHNCNHFAQAFCDLLSTTEKLQVPLWCNRAARIGDRVIPRRLATKVQRMLDDEPPRAVAVVPSSNIKEVPISVVPREWYLHPSVFQPLRYIDESNALLADAREGPSAAAAQGSTHYNVEYDIVPPPGYERANSEIMHPSLARREIYSTIDKKGSITHTMVIEDQRTFSLSLEGEAAQHSTASCRTAKSTSDNVIAPPSLGITFMSGGDDCVVLPRKQASQVQPQKLDLAASPQGLEAELDLDNVSYSDAEEELSPSVVLRIPLVSSGNSTNWRQSESSDQQQHHNLETNSRDASTDTSLDNALYSMRESSFRSMCIGPSEYSDTEASPPPSPSLYKAPQVTPVGCITTVSPTQTNASIEQPSQVASDAMADRHDPSTSVQDTSVHVSHSLKGAVSPPKSKHNKQKSNRSKKKEWTLKKKTSTSLSDMASALICDASLSSIPPPAAAAAAAPAAAAPAAAAPEKRKRKNSSPWTFLKSNRHLSSSAGNEKTVGKYLPTRSSSNKMSSVVDEGLRAAVASVSPKWSIPFPSPEPDAHQDKAATSVVADSSGLPDPTADSTLPSRWERSHARMLPFTALDSLASTHTLPVSSESNNREQDVLYEGSQSTNNTSQVQSSSSDWAVLETQPPLSPGCKTVHLPLILGIPAAESTRQHVTAPSEQLLSHTKMSLMQSGKHSYVNLTDLFLTQSALSIPESPGTLGSPPVRTPERHSMITNSRADTPLRSLTTFSRQHWRASSSAAMDDTPLLGGVQNQTPFPSAPRQHLTEHGTSSFPQPDLGSDGVKPKPLSNDSCHSRGTWEAHTPIAPFPRRPSFMYREVAAMGDDVVGQATSGECCHTTLYAPPILGFELESPERTRLTPSGEPSPPNDEQPTTP